MPVARLANFPNPPRNLCLRSMGHRLSTLPYGNGWRYVHVPHPEGMERNCSSARFSRHGQNHHNGNVTWSRVARSWRIGWVHCRFAARTDDSGGVGSSNYSVSARGQRFVSSFAEWNGIVHDIAYGIAYAIAGIREHHCASARNSWLSEHGEFFTEHGAAGRNGRYK